MRHSERGRTIADRYELEKMLGQGGMGEVWSATDAQTGTRVAVKLLKSGASDSKENRGRFEREARIAKTLVSPHITRVTDSGLDEEGDPFMVLELLQGEDLQKKIKTEKALPVSFVVGLAIQVGRALHVAHSAGLVHRDLKPGNIFLAKQGDEEVIKVLDFGIAKTGSMESTQYTSAGAMLGTSSYMSPEQIRNAKTVDHRADLWAFAVVLFRALTGELPFPQTGFELFLALAEDPIPSPVKVTSLVPSLPGPLNVFFERAFLKDMEQRYQSASAMVVGFCRAAGVTVPADVLYAADARTPSGQFAAMPPPSGSPMSAAAPSSGSRGPQGGPMSGPVPSSGSQGSHGSHGSPMSAQPPSAPPSRDQGLAGTMMLDPPSDHAGGPEHGSWSSPAAGRPAEHGYDAMRLDPDEPDNAATLFYQPGIKDLPAGPPPGPPPGPPGPPPSPGFAGGAAKQPVFTMPLDAARAAAQLADGGGHPGSQGDASQGGFARQTGGWQNVAPVIPGTGDARPVVSPPRVWLWVVILVVLAIAAGGAAFFSIGPD